MDEAGGLEPPLTASEAAVLPLDDISIETLDGMTGFEPVQEDSKSSVLPLDDIPIGRLGLAHRALRRSNRVGFIPRSFHQRKI